MRNKRDFHVFPYHASAIEIEIRREYDTAVKELLIIVHHLATGTPFPVQADVDLAGRLTE